MFNKIILPNIVAFVILCAVIIWSFWGNWQNMVSCIGSIASVQGMVIALCELHKVKNSTEAAMAKLGEVARLFSYADIERHIEICSYVSLCLQNGQYEAAAIRMTDIKRLLNDIKKSKLITQYRCQNVQELKNVQELIRYIGVDIEAVRGKSRNETGIDLKLIQKHVNNVSTFLQEVSAGIKQSAYVEKV